MTYIPDEVNNYAPAWLVYQKGGDDCDGLAIFAAYLLQQHGYKAYNMGIQILTPYGHNVALYENPSNGKFYTIDTGYGPNGPFNTVEEAALFHISLGEVRVAPGETIIIHLFDPTHQETVYPETYPAVSVIQFSYNP